jgi:ketosteroid isomerase-like protein
MGSDDAVETVAHAFTAFNRRDLPGLLALCHADIEWVPMRETVEGRVYRGSDGVREAMAEVDYEFEELQNDPRRWTEVGGRIVVVGRFVAKERRSGLRIDNPVAWLCEVRDGLVAYVRAFPSEEAALEALNERQ